MCRIGCVLARLCIQSYVGMDRNAWCAVTAKEAFTDFHPDQLTVARSLFLFSSHRFIQLDLNGGLQNGRDLLRLFVQLPFSPDVFR